VTVKRNNKGWEMVPAAPFQNWIAERVAMYRAELNAGLCLQDYRNELGARDRLAKELGWSQRMLLRYSKGLLATSRGGVKAEIRTGWLPRRTVEDALNLCGVQFWEIYPDIAAAEDRPFEPERWCPECGDRVTVLDGCCAWCDWQFTELRRAA
jgi:hypothetical protein